MWSTASESIRNGWYNSDRPSCSSRLAQPGLTAVDRFWFRRWSSHEPNQLHKLIECISNVFWSPEYAQKYKLCVSTSKWRVSLVWEDWADKCSLRFPGFACKLKKFKIVHSITLLCFCLNYVWTLLFTMFTGVEHLSALIEMHFYLLLNSVPWNYDRRLHQFSRSKLIWIGLNSNSIRLMWGTSSEPNLRLSVKTAACAFRNNFSQRTF